MLKENMGDVTLKELEARARRRGDKPALRLINEIKKLDKKHKNPLHVGSGMPNIGDDIYVDTSLYLDRPEDDVEGGLAEVIKIEQYISGIYITVKEHTENAYNWEYLREEQKRLKKEFGKTRASDTTRKI